jgi:hypothetical protein
MKSKERNMDFLYFCRRKKTNRQKRKNDGSKIKIIWNVVEMIKGGDRKKWSLPNRV